MVRLSANLSMLFTEAPYRERFGMAARCGFRAVEALFPHADAPAADVAAELKRHGLSLVLLNAPPGDWAAGERGLAGIAAREEEHEASLAAAFAYARAVGCPRVHVLAGNVADGASEDVFVRRLRRAAPAAEAAGITLCVEALNAHDVPGYLIACPPKSVWSGANQRAPTTARRTQD
jgi:hydroxypyruvate isomerase